MPSKIPPIKLSKFIKFLEHKGLELIRVKGDHFMYNRVPPIRRPLILVLKDPIPKQYIKKYLAQIDSTTEEFLDFIN
jgi:predicted RNA binding protein YcfA (HicA-like mRNA interferase family)